jgi:hypothetical protein
MIEPTDDDVSRLVIYRERSNIHRGHGERGVITSFNDSFVFVRYGTDAHSKATMRRDLEWADERAG